MRKVLVVGAGQAGLHLGHGLLQHGYDVTLITSRTSVEQRRGKPPLVGFALPRVVAAEQRLHLDFWQDQAPHIPSVRLSFRQDSTHQVEFSGRFSRAATVIDRRIKCADWLEAFEDRGGKVVIHGVTTTDLDYFSRMFDLVVVAVGGGELGELFELDPSRLTDASPRVVTQLLLDDDPADGEVRVISGPWGEVFDTPLLTQDGRARAIFLASEPEGSVDCSGLSSLEEIRGRLARYAPDVAERLRDQSLLDERWSLTSKCITPAVRKPVGRLPSGGLVVGVGDVLMRSDPITGRDTPDETLAAESYLQSILAHGDKPFTFEVLQSLFEDYYQAHAHASAQVSQIVRSWWTREPAPHVLALLAATQTHQEVADRYVEGFDDPSIYISLLDNPEQTYALLAEVGAIPAAPETAPTRGSSGPTR